MAAQSNGMADSFVKAKPDAATARRYITADRFVERVGM
ncbi:hypothetical protein C7S15_1794 [Burkholderia cepacia]|nr:hypothetical protein [Burkholderia cepacia]